jgi:hypothetical protein
MLKPKNTRYKACFLCKSIHKKCDQNDTCKRCKRLNIKCIRKMNTLTNLLDEINRLQQEILTLKKIISNSLSESKNDIINHNCFLVCKFIIINIVFTYFYIF